MTRLAVRRAASWIVVGLAGCATSEGGVREAVGKLSVAPQLTSRGLDGARADALAGYGGVQLGLGAFGQTEHRTDDSSSHTVGGVDLIARLSLFGALNTTDDHTFEHWFDLGGEGGIGGGVVGSGSPAALGHAWVGGWIDVGLWTGDTYPVLVLGIRRQTSTQPWESTTIATIGLGWMYRTTDVFIVPK